MNNFDRRQLTRSYSVVVELPETVKDSLNAAVAPMRQNEDWVVTPRYNYHITLAVINSLTLEFATAKQFSARRRALESRLEKIAKNSRPLEVSLSQGLSFFGNGDRKYPYIVNADIEARGNIELVLLWKALMDSFGEDYPTTRRDISPHIALARAPRGAEEKLRCVAENVRLSVESFKVNHVSLAYIKPLNDPGCLVNTNGLCGRIVTESSFPFATAPVSDVA